jgi:(E)-4-hydroxy-3-methylbut-2-enyl-diphosphate synthase
MTKIALKYNRRISSEVQIGNLLLGGKQLICVQSMTNTSTLDTPASVAQAIRIIKAGGKLVRLTAQGVREAENLQFIRKGLLEKGYETPLVADIHFNPKAAEVAALYVQKVRINPGNFVDSIKTFAQLDYTDQEYQQELDKIKQRLLPLLKICKDHKTAIRIGVNHGSLSDRIMSRYGDTPQGMVASCLEFLRICREDNFNQIVISIKASNTLVMVQTVRLLVSEMDKEGMAYPLHLGVTEAGDGEDGRVKSAVGIGTLLAEGLGDTIRVSLSEEPEDEIPVAKKLVVYINTFAGANPIMGEISSKINPYEYKRRETHAVKNIGGDNLPVVISNSSVRLEPSPDYIFSENNITDSQDNSFPVYNISGIKNISSSDLNFLSLSYTDLTEDVLSFLQKAKNVVVLLQTTHQHPILEQRAFFYALLNHDCTTPVVICRNYNETQAEDLQIKSATDIGALLLDGLGDGVFITNKSLSAEIINSTAFGILQAARVRVSRTEYISCPSCGRTLFDLQTVIKEIKSRTSHIKGLKIGIMGCIVNGPGEMADADYGYVGAGRGKVSLYKKQDCVEKNIDEKDAVEHLVKLIKTNGDWID